MVSHTARLRRNGRYKPMEMVFFWIGVVVLSISLMTVRPRGSMIFANSQLPNSPATSRRTTNAVRKRSTAPRYPALARRLSMAIEKQRAAATNALHSAITTYAPR
jgi:hypothetical protein